MKIIIQLYKWQIISGAALTFIVGQAGVWLLGVINDIIAISPFAATFVVSWFATAILVIVGTQALLYGAYKLYIAMKGKPAKK